MIASVLALSGIEVCVAKCGGAIDLRPIPVHRRAVGAKCQRGPLHESLVSTPQVDVQAKLDRVVFALKEAE